MKNLLKMLWLSECALALLIMCAVADSTMAYISLFVLVYGIWKLPDRDALRLYIYSIPIFVALPPNSLSDSMSIWRFALLAFVLKICMEKSKEIGLFDDEGSGWQERGRKAAGAMASFVSQVKRSSYGDLALAATAFGGTGLISLLFAQSLGAGIKKLIFLGSLFLLFGIVMASVKNRDEAKNILRAVFVSGVGMTAVGYLQFISTFFINLYDFWGLWNNSVINAFYGEKMVVLLSYSNTWFSYYGADNEIPPTLRMFSLQPDSHSFSLLMILFVPLSLYYYFGAKKKEEKRKYLFVLALMLLAVFFSGSRGAWVGYLGAFAAAAYFYLYGKLPKRARIIRVKDPEAQKMINKAVFGSMLLFVVLIPLASFSLNVNQDLQLYREGRTIEGGRRNAFLQRTLSISDMEETSNKGRLEIWRDSVVSFSHHPILGIGIGNFPLALSERIGTSKMGASAHNIYLDVAVEMGLAGLLAFLWISWIILMKLLSLSQKFPEEDSRLLALSLFVSFVWMCAYGMFDVVILNDRVLAFVVIIVALMYRMEALEAGEKPDKGLGQAKNQAG